MFCRKMSSKRTASACRVQFAAAIILSMIFCRKRGGEAEFEPGSAKVTAAQMPCPVEHVEMLRY